MGDPILTSRGVPVFSRDDHFVLDGEALAGFPEPAAVVDEAGRLLAASPHFTADMGFVADGGLAEVVRDCLFNLIRQRRRLRCPVRGAAGERVFDLSVVPLAAPRRWLLLASESTVEVGLRNALVESRARYMDLVGLSGEFAWETTAEGRFGIVTQDGLAGRSARDLIGSDPSLLLDPSMAAPAVLPFTTPSPVEGLDVWLRHADGHALCYQTAAVPLCDASGLWRGARGICRDVTEERRDRAYLAELRHRERLIGRITGIFRAESNPDDMLKAAAEAAAEGLGGCGGQVFTTHHALGADQPSLALVVAWGRTEEPAAVEALLEGLVNGKVARSVAFGPWSLLMAPAVYGGRLIGAILLWRADDQPDWSEADAALLAAVAGPLAAAMEQRTHYHLLLDASRTDVLTSLFNRRAFDDEMRRRFHRLERDAAPAALVYVDLDNFKAVNDIHGHDVGDEALRHMADILRSNTRSTDLVARLGGDEFAVWLENADEKVAIKRARIFLTAAKPLTRYSGSPDKLLRLSIGVAVYDPKAREELGAFVKRADQAMYQVKRGGKGSYALAAAAGTKR